MDNVTKLIANFSNRSRIKFEDNKLTVTSLGNKKHDFILLGSFCLVVIAIYVIASDTSSSPIIYILVLVFTLIVIYIIFYFLSKGDNIVCFDFMNMEVIIKRRSPLFRMFPSSRILFRNISHFKIEPKVDAGEYIDMKSYNVCLQKNAGFIQNVTLINFDVTERNSADHLLWFLKKTLTGT